MHTQHVREIVALVRYADDTEVFAKPDYISTANGDQFYTPGAGVSRIIDLGMVSLRDAAIYGWKNILIPYSEGRVISGIRYVPGGTAPTTGSIFFVTPNTSNEDTQREGFGGYVAGVGGPKFDTVGIITETENTGIGGTPDTNSQILDCGPLTTHSESNGVERGREAIQWEANTPFCKLDWVLDDNDHVQIVTTNGVSGSTIPTFSTSGGTTSDGSVTWTDQGLLQGDGEVHVVAEVVEGISPMPPYPATLEFLVPPATAVAGETMANFSLILKDQFGEPYTFSVMGVEVEIYGAGTLSVGVGVVTDKDTGIALFEGASIAEPGTYILRAHLYPWQMDDPIFSDPFDVT